MACNDIPRLLVERDTAAPAEPRFGLFSAATIVESMDPRAGNGVEYITTCTPGVYPYPVVDCGDDAQHKTADRSLAITRADPFAVYAAESCPPVGRGSTNAQIEALRRRLTMGERHTVEAAVFSGYAGASPYLRHADTTQIFADQTHSLVQAVGLLEQWLATRGRTGIIHAPRWVAPVLDAAGVVHRDGPRLRTVLGNGFAFGSGYTGQGPEGVEDGQVWLYATPQVTIRRSDIIERRSFSISTNTPFDLAERMYVVDWPCGAAAVPTDVALVEGVVPDPDPPALAMLTMTPDSGQAPLEVSALPTGFGGGQVHVSWVDGVPVNTVTEDGVPAPLALPNPGVYVFTAFLIDDPTVMATATVTVTGPDQDDPPPSPPTGVSVDPTPWGGDVTWDASAPGVGLVDSYQVRYRQLPDGSWSDPVPVEPTQHTHTLEGLSPNSSYEVEVLAVGTGGASAPATAQFTTTTTQGVSTPESLTTVQVSDSTITLAWEWDQGEGPDVTGFSTDYRPPSGQEWSDAVDVGPDARQVTFTGLTPATTYDLRVTAESADGSSSSQIQVGTDSADGLSAPTGLMVHAATDTSLSLSWGWVLGLVPATGFEVRVRAVGEAGWSDPIMVGATGRSVTVDGLSAGVEYEVQVAARSLLGLSAAVTLRASTHSG